MIRRDSFINKIRELDYSYKTQQKRTYLYRRKNGTDYISVPMADLLEDEYVMHALRQAHCTEESILLFIASCKC
jgi:hypothetical protein